MVVPEVFLHSVGPALLPERFSGSRFRVTVLAVSGWQLARRSS